MHIAKLDRKDAHGKITDRTRNITFSIIKLCLKLKDKKNNSIMREALKQPNHNNEVPLSVICKMEYNSKGNNEKKAYTTKEHYDNQQDHRDNLHLDLVNMLYGNMDPMFTDYRADNRDAIIRRETTLEKWPKVKKAFALLNCYELDSKPVHISKTCVVYVSS